MVPNLWNAARELRLAREKEFYLWEKQRGGAANYTTESLEPGA